MCLFTRRSYSAALASSNSASFKGQGSAHWSAREPLCAQVAVRADAAAAAVARSGRQPVAKALAAVLLLPDVVVYVYAWLGKVPQRRAVCVFRSLLGLPSEQSIPHAA
jgi:hypothetical protein